MTKYEATTPAAAFVSGALMVPTAVTAKGRGLSAAMRNDQDATTGFSTWSPPD